MERGLLRGDLLLAGRDRLGLRGEEDLVRLRVGRRGRDRLGRRDKDPPPVRSVQRLPESVSPHSSKEGNRREEIRPTHCLVFSSVVFFDPSPDAQTYITAALLPPLPPQADERHLFLPREERVSKFVQAA